MAEKETGEDRVTHQESGQDVEAGEAKRARVRRLLIDPLARDGMRFKKGTPEDVQRRTLARIADDLAYMTDRGLEVLAEWMRCHAEGAARCFWPGTVAIISTAETFEPRPLSELPALVRWFGSAAGAQALVGDRLVAEYEFWRKFKRPPVKPGEQKRVADRAAEWSSRVARIEDRVARGLAPLHDDGAWLAWYRATEARAQALVDQPSEVAA